MVRRKGLEPLTYWFVASHSIQLSYRRIALEYNNILVSKMQVLFSKNRKNIFIYEKGKYTAVYLPFLTL